VPEAHGATRVLVHHPGSNHLAYRLVASLQQDGWDARFESGYFHAPGGLPARLAARLPARLRVAVERELASGFTRCPSSATSSPRARGSAGGGSPRWSAGATTSSTGRSRKSCAASARAQ
jgi:hypothetical protein